MSRATNLSVVKGSGFFDGYIVEERTGKLGEKVVIVVGAAGNKVEGTVVRVAVEVALGGTVTVAFIE